MELVPRKSLPEGESLEIDWVHLLGLLVSTEVPALEEVAISVRYLPNHFGNDPVGFFGHSSWLNLSLKNSVGLIQ